MITKEYLEKIFDEAEEGFSIVDGYYREAYIKKLLEKLNISGDDIEAKINAAFVKAMNRVAIRPESALDEKRMQICYYVAGGIKEMTAAIREEFGLEESE